AMPSIDELRRGFMPIAQRFHMDWRLQALTVRMRVLIAVSRRGHCLYDLLHRWRSGALAMDVVGVVSNHDDLRSFVEWNGLPYYHWPVTPATKAAQEARLLELIARERVDLLVLARYMQILSPLACAALAGRCINIHHAFLPGFKGAKPYHQAYSRGVKIIGATAHYVTTDLDEGPIIEQDVARVSHAHTPAALEQIGRDIECVVLARAVAWHIEHRVLIAGHKTIVFN
ncbi:MAG: formyltetrahydrofolate deformylase, partial [Steroidobacteraceae bacterium]|nr:formyltetrahydrofolate deformylase [Steroidobacteraceae bacterium]